MSGAAVPGSPLLDPKVNRLTAGKGTSWYVVTRRYGVTAASASRVVLVVLERLELEVLDLLLLLLLLLELLELVLGEN